MKKIHLILVFSLILLVIALVPNMVNAADTFTTSDGIKVKKVVTGYTQGSIELEISNFKFSSEGNYEWAISATKSISEDTKWYVLGDINASKGTAKVNLTVQEKDILAILRKTDTAYLFVKDANSTFINGLQLDLTLPPLYAFAYTTWLDNWYISVDEDEWAPSTYNIQNLFYKFEKITDQNLVEKYKQAIKDGTDINNVFSITKQDVEKIENWTGCTRDYEYPFTKIAEEKLPKDAGAYYLWLKGKDVDSKTVYGCLIVNIDGPTVDSIYVSSPKSGTYKTSQTVKIEVNFSDKITGTTVPTLKIRFGNSPIRTLTNGTIRSEYKDIVYSYNIQAGDNGQLSVVSLEGGDIVDAKGNKAEITCPLISGFTIKANTEGTVTNQTDNQDKTNDKTTNDKTTESNSNDETTTNSSKDKTTTSSSKDKTTTNTSKDKTTTSSSKDKTTTSSSKDKTTTSSSKDKTTTTSKKKPSSLPYTGVIGGISIMILCVVVIGGIAYIKYRRLRGI